MNKKLKDPALRRPPDPDGQAYSVVGSLGGPLFLQISDPYRVLDHLKNPKQAPKKAQRSKTKAQSKDQAQSSNLNLGL